MVLKLKSVKHLFKDNLAAYGLWQVANQLPETEVRGSLQ